MSKYRKAIVALVGVAVTLGLIDEGTGQDIAGVLTVILTYLIPND